VKLFFVVDFIPKKIGSPINIVITAWTGMPLGDKLLEKIGSIVALKITSADPVG
jgi:hypothetical protein